MNSWHTNLKATSICSLIDASRSSSTRTSIFLSPISFTMAFVVSSPQALHNYFSYVWKLLLLKVLLDCSYYVDVAQNYFFLTDHIVLRISGTYIYISFVPGFVKWRATYHTQEQYLFWIFISVYQIRHAQYLQFNFEHIKSI